ncbi:MAG: hypothetical protein JWO38_2855 [Gemmataceae bacterium]|nr:hypothetical protein [Gemmataceae bacterium]
MDRQQILLAKSLEAAEVPLSVNTFHDRLILQKAVYLLQAAGIHLGYRFRWYIRGPYSPDMTSGAFGIANEGEYAEAELRGWKLDDESATRARNLHSLLHQEGESKTDQARRLELLASALFLFKTDQAKPGDPEGTATILKRNNKEFSAAEVKSAVKELRAHGLLA